MIDIFTDSDWAGDKIDRKSVSCVVTLIGGHCIRCQTATQTVPALSSGEAEYVGNVKGGSVGIGMQSMARDFGDERVVRIATDSSASKGIASRLGFCKIRHLDTGLLWLQHHVRRKVLQLVKTVGSGNPADIGTKDLAEKDMKRIMDKLGFQERTGRHPKALCISGGAGSPAPTEEEGLSQLNGSELRQRRRRTLFGQCVACLMVESAHRRGGVCGSDRRLHVNCAWLLNRCEINCLTAFCESQEKHI